jgi:hypothetical protein
MNCEILITIRSCRLFSSYSKLFIQSIYRYFIIGNQILIESLCQSQNRLKFVIIYRLLEELIVKENRLLSIRIDLRITLDFMIRNTAKIAIISRDIKLITEIMQVLNHFSIIHLLFLRNSKN